MTLTKTDWQSGIEVQDACNLHAVVNSLARVLTKLDCGTDAKNKHPLVVLYIDKLTQLCGLQGNEVSTFAAAYAEVIKQLQ